MSFTIDLDKLDLNFNKQSALDENSISSNDIAIIGMSGKFGSATSLDEYWTMISQGIDFIEEVPNSRKKDIEDFLKSKYIDTYEYAKGAFLENISEFDYDFFGLSPKDASLMDPNQRLLLTETWKALESAGYAGSALKGSQTGVFIGFSSDFGNSYKDFIIANDPTSLDIALAGNIKSVIAGRISYFFDFKGPAITFDTACSSALVALYQSCRSIINKDCDTAIVGSIKVTPTPIRCDKYNGVGLQNISGVESKDGRTRTFDNSSSGTGMGEGMGVLIVKRLSEAIDDRDNIIAVVKGGAINQDGASLGITAPNSLAQKEVIIKAWENAEIEPSSIHYIEAHGTGTSLGDPIEVDGILKAFNEYTKQKQFCAIGSVKSNIGHLDHAAGMAGLMKVILSLTHKQLPPLLHFQNPNRKIDFINSPLYVNDKLSFWTNSNNLPRRAGISAFGLSGTNCHLILEEAPILNSQLDDTLSHFFLPLSAKSKDVLLALIDKYVEFLELDNTINLSSLTKTASIGRGHYSFRLFFIFDSIKELIKQIKQAKEYLLADELASINYYGYHSVYQTPTRTKLNDELTYSEIKDLTQDANAKLLHYSKNNNSEYLHAIARLYVNGASLDWNILFQNYIIHRINLPTYPFARTNSWVSPNVSLTNAQPNNFHKEIEHPLIDRCVLNFDSLAIYSVDMTPNKYWELSEHVVLSEYVLPGTAYIQMVIGQMQDLLKTSSTNFIIDDLYFVHRFALNAEENRELKTILKKEDDIYQFRFISFDQNLDEWILHAEGKIHVDQLVNSKKINITEIKNSLSISKEFNIEETIKRGLKTGKRWNCNKGVNYNKDKTEYLSYLELNQFYHSDLDTYSFHPSLADCAINAINFFISDDLYLPFSYKKLIIHRPLTAKIFAYFKLRQTSQEIFTFDVYLVDLDGNVLVEALDYSIKKVVDHDVFNTPLLHFNWIKDKKEQFVSPEYDGPILVVCRQNHHLQLFKNLKNSNNSLIFAYSGNHFEKISATEYLVSDDENDIKSLIDAVSFTDLRIVYVSFNEEIIEAQHNGVVRELTLLFSLIKQLLNSQIAVKNGIYIAAHNAYSLSSADINPFGSALLALGNNIRYEYPKLGIKLFNFSRISELDIVFKMSADYVQTDITSIDNDSFYIRNLEKYDLKDYAIKPIQYNEDGVYLITGGLGDLGLAIASHLSQTVRCKVILISRKALPIRENWDSILTRNEDKDTCNILNQIKNIEESGSQVIIYSADIASEKSISRVIDDVYTRYQIINGVFHCAGIGGKGYLINKSKDTFIDTIRPKITGSVLLTSLLDKSKLDFILFFSSVNAILPENGQTDYASANAFMDAYAGYLQKENIHAISYNWPAWEEIGMAVKHKVDLSANVFNSISPKEALNIIDKTICYPFRSVLPITLNEEYVLKNNIELPFSISNYLRNNLNINNQRMDINIMNSVLLKGCDEITETLQSIGNIWGTILGIKEIDIHESFYNLGGNSIMATSMLKKYQELFPGVVDIADVFTFTTIYDMNKHILSDMNKEAASQEDLTDSQKTIDMEMIINKLSSGDISAEEAEVLMQQINL